MSNLPNIYGINLLANGFSLLEVLIALTILSIGLLSIAHVQINSLLLNDEAYFHSIATEQVDYLYESALVDPEEIVFWQQTNQKLLPQGEGSYKGDLIEVCWFDRFLLQKKCLRNK